MNKAILAITVIAVATSVAYFQASVPRSHQTQSLPVAFEESLASAEMSQESEQVEKFAKPKVSFTEDELQAPSQQDTEVDQASLRDTFDYFLSGFDDSTMDIEQLKTRVREFMARNHERYRPEHYDLFEQYLLYKELLMSIEVEQALSLDDLIRIDNELREHQLSFFSIEEQLLLFSDENFHRQVTIKKMSLKDIAVSNNDYNYLLKEALDEMPEEIRRVYQDDLISAQLNQVANYEDEQQRYIAYETLIGTEAAQRMVELEQRELALNQKIERYLEQRRQILNSSVTIDKEYEIARLRESFFEPSDHRRIMSLESIDDL